MEAKRLINELRVGNYVRHNKKWCYRDNDTEIEFQWELSDFYAIEQCTMFEENISPIPLTEEWLEKFGGERGGKKGDDWNDKFFKFKFNKIDILNTYTLFRT